MRPSVRFVFVCSLTSLVTLIAPASPLAPRPAAQSFPSDDPVIRAIWQEGVERSQVHELGQVMMDSIGPRLTGSPAMAGANDWALAKYAEWGIEAYKEQYGTWRGWERGISHIDLIAPRVRSLEGLLSLKGVDWTKLRAHPKVIAWHERQRADATVRRAHPGRWVPDS